MLFSLKKWLTAQGATDRSSRPSVFFFGDQTVLASWKNAAYDASAAGENSFARQRLNERTTTVRCSSRLYWINQLAESSMNRNQIIGLSIASIAVAIPAFYFFATAPNSVAFWVVGIGAGLVVMLVRARSRAVPPTSTICCRTLNRPATRSFPASRWAGFAQVRFRPCTSLGNRTSEPRRRSARESSSSIAVLCCATIRESALRFTPCSNSKPSSAPTSGSSRSSIRSIKSEFRLACCACRSSRTCRRGGAGRSIGGLPGTAHRL